MLMHFAQKLVQMHIVYPSIHDVLATPLASTDVYELPCKIYMCCQGMSGGRASRVWDVLSK